MKKKPSDTIKLNRGVGDQRVRNLENCVSDMAEVVNEHSEKLAEATHIELVTALPSSPDPDVLYMVYE